MTDLITRLEAATEGTRELDAEVYALILGSDWYAKPQFEDGSGEWLVYSRTAFADRAKTHPQCKSPPAYTSKPYDLTAAMTLVPKGWRVYAVQQDEHGKWFAGLDQFRGGGAVYSGRERKPTPALALTAAALEAREIEND